jgi:hypothetical protein
MKRNTLYLLLAASIFFSSIWQASVTGASNQRAAEQQQINPPTLQVQPVSLRNYDIRADIRTAAPSSVNQLGVAVAATDSQAMQNAIESFRERFSPPVGPPPHIRFRGVGIFKMVSSDHRCILHLFPAPIRRGLASVATGASHERAA